MSDPAGKVNPMAAIMERAIKAGMDAAKGAPRDEAKHVCIKDIMPIQQRLLADQMMKMYALSVTQSRLTGCAAALGLGSAEKNNKIIAAALKNVGSPPPKGSEETEQPILIPTTNPDPQKKRRVRFGGNFGGHYCVITVSEEGPASEVHVFVPDIQAEASASLVSSLLRSETDKLDKESVLGAISVSIIAEGVSGTDGPRVMISSNKEGLVVASHKEDYDEHAAAAAIQGIHRKRLAHQQKEAKRKEQYDFFAALEVQVEKEEKAESAELIQSIHRGRKAKREVGAKREQKHAAVTIQSRHRGRAAKREVTEKRGQHQAATAIQSRHRGRAATKAVNEKRAQGGDKKPVPPTAGDGDDDSTGDWSDSDDGDATKDKKAKEDSDEEDSDDGEWTDED
jgi:hypothetical protein